MDMPQPQTAWKRTWTAAVVVVALGAAVLGNLQAEKPAAVPRQAAPIAKPGSLVAIADLHGDLEKAKQALQLLNVVDSQGRWTAEDITVVQLGDLVDRGPSSVELVRYMHSLQDEALRHNSCLVLLLGNHELLNLHGDYRYVSPEELKQLGQQQQQQQQRNTVAASGNPSSQNRTAAAPAAAAAAAAAAEPGVAAQHDAATAAYLAGLEAWEALWGKPSDSQTPDTSASAVEIAAVAATAASGGDTGGASIGSGSAAAGGGVAAEAAAGSVRSSVVARHQLLAVHGRGGPCATAFVHAGLLSQSLNQLLLISSSSSSTSTTEGAPHVITATHKVLHRMHDRRAALVPDDSSKLQAITDITAAAAAAAAVPAGVVSAGELQAINSAVRQALQSCDDRACDGGTVQQQRAMAVLGSGQGPVWTRQQAQGREAGVCRHLEQVLARLGVHRLVVGHTPQAAGRAAARCGGRLLLLDTGMSSGMLGSPAAAWVCHAGDLDGPQHDQDQGSGVEGGAESIGGAGDFKSVGSSSSGEGSDSSFAGDVGRAVGNYLVVAYADGIVTVVYYVMYDDMVVVVVWWCGGHGPIAYYAQ